MINRSVINSQSYKSLSYLTLVCAMVMCSFAFMATTTNTAYAASKEEGEKLIDEAFNVLQKAVSSGEDSPVRKAITEAMAVIIVPGKVRGSFIFGVSGGSGVLLIKNQNGRESWSSPAFVSSKGLSFGLQIGIDSSESITVVYNQEALDTIIDGAFKVGGGAGVTVGNVGKNREAQTVGTKESTTDTEVFSSSAKGGYVGASLEGGTYSNLRALNQAYYESDLATPESIVLEGRFSSISGDRLRKLLGSIQ